MPLKRVTSFSHLEAYAKRKKFPLTPEAIKVAQEKRLQVKKKNPHSRSIFMHMHKRIQSGLFSLREQYIYRLIEALRDTKGVIPQLKKVKEKFNQEVNRRVRKRSKSRLEALIQLEQELRVARDRIRKEYDDHRRKSSERMQTTAQKVLYPGYAGILSRTRDQVSFLARFARRELDKVQK